MSRLLQPDTNPKISSQVKTVHPLLGVSNFDRLGLGITWRNTLKASALLSLVDQHVSLPGVFPAAGYVKIVAEASLKLSGSKVLRKFELDDFFVENDMSLARDEDQVQITVELQSTGSHERHGDRTDFINFRIRSDCAGLKKLNALGCLHLRSSDGYKSLSLATATHPKLLNEKVTQDAQPSSKIIKSLPMSFGQSGFWFMTQFIEDPTFFNGTVSFLITTNLDIDALAHIVREMGRRHEGLRTAFFTDDHQQAKQGVLDESPLYLQTKVIGSQDEVRAEIDAMNNHVYDLAKGETLRLLLLTESPIRHHLIVGYHHINIDGMSIIAITDDLRLAYEGKKLPPPFQQNEFADRQHERLRTGQYAEDILFWKNEFKDLPETLPILPLSPNTLRSRPAVRTTYRHLRAESRLSPLITARLHKLRKQGYIQSPFNFYVTVFQVLLGRLAESEDICIGVASANRHNDPGSDSSVGIFLNLFPLRLRSQLSKSFVSLLEENKAKGLACLNHSAVPFDIILDEVGAIRHPSHSPLFQAFINYIPTRENRSFGDGIIENREYEIGETIYDIMLAVIDPPAGDPWIAIMTQKELYTENEAQILLDCFMNLVDAFTADIQLPGRQAQMFNDSAIQKAIKLGQGISLDTELGSLIGHLDDISARLLDQIALKDTCGGMLSYGGMMDKSAQIAHALSTSGIHPRSRIGVLQDPTVDWICSMLGIWRFGASYVPLEVTQGIGRLRSIINDADLTAILIHDATQNICKDIGIAEATPIFNVSTIGGSKEATSLSFYNPIPTDEAIVLYTSGSTGTPKGISLPHRMVTNTIKGFLKSFPMKPQTVLQQIALSFDVSWWQSLLGLATGGTVVIAGKDVRKDPFALTGLIASQMITLTLAVPSEAMSWLQNGDFQQLRKSRWEWHISAGEEVRSNLVEKLKGLDKPDLRFLNAYGPAETIVPHAYEIPYRDPSLTLSNIPIGKVLPNYSVYIMDGDNHPLPAGVPGQIVIGGAGVASGYINQPALTMARFPKDALASSRAVANGWIHAHLSGDRGYMREDGVFVTLGRMSGDTQVKLRGQRFELREVEAAMVAAGKGDILEVVAHIRQLDKKDAASAFLVAHVVLATEIQKKYGTNGPIIDSMLRNIISELALPQYMRPSIVVSLPSMPLNHHGKVDRKHLSKSPLKAATEPLKVSALPPLDSSTQFLRVIEEIWRDILGDLVAGQKLDQNSDFFLVGGNSLLLIKVQSKIKERNGHNIPLVSLFEASTLGKMSAILAENRERYGERPKGGSSEDKMKQIWVSVLGKIVTEDNLGSDSDFFLVGGNSLLLIRIQTEVHKDYGVLLPLAKLFESSTLGGMSILLDALTTEDNVFHQNLADIDWKDEVAFKEQLSSIIMNGKDRNAVDDPSGGITVALTGATGFLGRHILQKLVNDSMVETVHCIAVRDASKPIINSPKVIVHSGDLRDSSLGLTEDTARHIFSKLSVIIHNGADVSFLRAYRTLRAANVLSTKTLVHLAIKYAAGRPLPHIHFISTAGVAQLGTGELYEESLPILQPQMNANGYVVSKWVSEKYLENAQSFSALPVTIHRPSYVLGPDAPQLDVMHNILNFAEKLRSVPRMPSVDRWLQFVGIDEVALDITAEALKKEDPQTTKVQYRNHCGTENDWVRLDQLGLYLERQHGGEFPKVDFTQWINSAGVAGMPTQVKEYLINLVTDNNASDRSWISPRVLKGPRNMNAPWRRQGRL
ncbi:non-ribosomal peptide synthetase [Trichoderma virens Gv29-8]|uniref:Non-ribosomal peptide synthetase n=1 Tax=Hypocrea virens (strain Gv29-8 / FGSC 10586) TaxID=413071 RepID=G9MVE1_HYPVG|nr:non-ribosomal peptide synthetase [Trichoderma virens Gv29-8]EHK21567.1 non-ribosomal peptide synthetase [Trichoderma virens Gv29-8]